jgi:hypothetical protein
MIRELTEMDHRWGFILFLLDSFTTRHNVIFEDLNTDCKSINSTTLPTTCHSEVD